MNKKLIFITGGCGFIGANLVKYLLDRGGYDITVYDNLSAGSKENLDRAISDSNQQGKVRFIKGDILDFAKLNRAIEGHNAIVHLAAHTRVVESLINPKENFAVNSIGTLNVLEAAKKNRIKRFIFASSNATIGEQKPPINEKMIPKPISPYGATKLHGEALCLAYRHSYDLKTVSLRFANAYGPYSGHKTSVVAKFIKRAKTDKSLEIYGYGNQTRDFIHAQDVCQAIYLALSTKNQPISDGKLHQAKAYPAKLNIWGEVFQIATGIETKIIDLAKMVQDLAVTSDSKQVKIIFKSKRKGEIQRNFSDIKKAKKLLGFRSQLKLDIGLKELWFYH